MTGNTLLRSRLILALVGITVIGVGLRLYRLDFQSLWYDELHSMVPTSPDNTVASIIAYCRIDQPPAFFLYLHAFFKLFPYESVYGRLAAALLGILGIPAMYLLGREVGGRAAGLFAAFVTAFNYFHIYYSQEVRFYSMAFLFTCFSYLFFVRAYKKPASRIFAGYIISTAILLYTHYYGLVIFSVQAFTFLLLVLFFRRDRHFVVGGVISGILVVVAFLPWVPIIIADLGIPTFWIKRPDALTIPEYFYGYFGKDALVTALGFGLFVLFVRTLVRDFRTMPGEQRGIYVIITAWLILSYAIPLVRSLADTPVLHIRYTIVTLPAWFLMFAVGWNVIAKEKTKYIVAGSIALSSVINLWFFRKYYDKVQKQQFREASMLVQQKNTAGYPVLSAYAWNYNFFFSHASDKVRPLDTDLSKVDGFWLLQAEFLTPAEKQQELSRFEHGFYVQASYPFFKAGAVLLRRKQGE